MNPSSPFLGRLRKHRLSKNTPEVNSQPANLPVSSEMNRPQPQPSSSSAQSEVPMNQSTVNLVTTASTSSTQVDYDSDQTEIDDSELSTFAGASSPVSLVNIDYNLLMEHPQAGNSLESVSIEKEIEVKKVEQKVEQNTIPQEEPKNLDGNNSEAHNVEVTEPETSVRAQLNPAVFAPDFISNIADSAFNELMSCLGSRPNQTFSGVQVNAILDVLQMAIKAKVTESVVLKKEKPKEEDNAVQQDEGPAEKE